MQIENRDEICKRWKERICRYVTGFAVLLVVYAVLIFLYIYPHLPADLTGWAILVILGVPSSLFLEFLGQSIFSEKIGQKISNNKFSAKRLAFALLVILILLAVSVIVWNQWDSFIRPHFK